MALIDFTLSNARRFYSSMGNPSGLKGLKENRGSHFVQRLFLLINISLSIVYLVIYPYVLCILAVNVMS